MHFSIMLQLFLHAVLLASSSRAYDVVRPRYSDGTEIRENDEVVVWVESAYSSGGWKVSPVGCLSRNGQRVIGNGSCETPQVWLAERPHSTFDLELSLGGEYMQKTGSSDVTVAPRRRGGRGEELAAQITLYRGPKVGTKGHLWPYLSFGWVTITYENTLYEKRSNPYWALFTFFKKGDPNIPTLSSPLQHS